METRGKINCYSGVDCNSRVYVILLANGVTPFIKFFNEAEHRSTFYRLPSAEFVVTHAWYRPTSEAFKALDPATQDHVLNGGLLCATLEKACSLQMPVDTVGAGDSYEEVQQFALTRYGRRLRPLSDPKLHSQPPSPIPPV